MANYAALKAALDAAIKTNQSNSITGDVLNSALDSMINALGAGYQYMGKATTSTNPGTPDFNVVYLAHNTTGSTATYTNFGNLTLVPGEIALLKYNGSWSKDTALTITGGPEYVPDSESIVYPVSSSASYNPVTENISFETFNAQ